MSHLIRIGAGVSAAAIAIALGIAFWPQFDRSLANGRAAVEKPVFVVPAAPVKLEAAVARPAPQSASSSEASPAPAAPTAMSAATSTDGGGDAALSKLALALRASVTPPASATPADLVRGFTVAPMNSSQTQNNDTARRLCAEGLVALAQGDIAGARAFLERAAEAGDPRALLALGETYDPAALARFGARGLRGDATRARDYYSQALAAGVGDARERMAALSSP
jgi:TPR repeat protein